MVFPFHAKNNNNFFVMLQEFYKNYCYFYVNKKPALLGAGLKREIKMLVHVKMAGLVYVFGYGWYYLDW